MQDKTSENLGSLSKRTNRQNKALHLWCEMLAETLNQAGISQAILLQGLTVDNSSESIKSVFRALGKAKYIKSSTADLTTKEITDIYDEFNRHLASLGIHVPWPTRNQHF